MKDCQSQVSPNELSGVRFFIGFQLTQESVVRVYVHKADVNLNSRSHVHA